jgi:uncharacterized protein with PIN domain
VLVVIDTSVWLSNLFLRSKAASSLHVYLDKAGGTIVVSEVVKLEVEHHLETQMTSWAREIKDNHRRLVDLFGSLSEVIVPADKQIAAFAKRFFERSGFEVRHLPFSFESAKNSFLRTTAKIPPSHKSQQFKDGVIWADCLSLLDESDVVFVTEDKAFFEGGDFQKGLEASLKREAESKLHKLSICYGLSQLLEKIAQPISFQKDALWESCAAENEAAIKAVLDKLDMSITGTPVVKASLFATQDPAVVFNEFEIRFKCEDNTSLGRTDCCLTITGNCTMNAAGTKFYDFQPNRISLDATGVEGDLIHAGHVFLAVNSAIIGPKIVSRVIKHPIESLIED